MSLQGGAQEDRTPARALGLEDLPRTPVGPETKDAVRSHRAAFRLDGGGSG
jgi:hypothetical protein